MSHDPTRQINLSINDVSKKFCKNLKRSLVYGILDVVKSSLGIRPDTKILRKDEFWAVNNLSIDVDKGDVLGVVGKNGSGKTTLLRMLAGILPPDTGSAKITGRLSSLLSMGIGFHPYMTVLENIYINGTVMGMRRREIDERLDYIVSFSGVGDFIHAPAGALSTGMNVRLGFSIALAVQPDIFLIDEVLSVGDQSFRKRCVEEIKNNCKQTIVIFVSHNMDMIRQLCNRIIVMEKGVIVYDGKNVAEGVQFYDSQKN